MKVTHVAKVVIPVTLCLLLLPAIVCAESVIYFVDGTSIQGDIRKSGISNYLITRENGKWEIVPASDIKAIRNGNEITYLTDPNDTKTETANEVPAASVQNKNIIDPPETETIMSSDKIFMDDGQIITGSIIETSDNYILIQSTTGTENIARKYIKRIVSNNANTNRISLKDTSSIEHNTRPFNKTQTVDAKSDETIIKFTIDANGQHKVDGNANILWYRSTMWDYNIYDIPLDGTADVNIGVSAGLEKIYYFNKHAGLGAGISYQFRREQKDINGEFNFIPVYGILKVRTLTDYKGRYFYAVGHLGYNAFYGDRTYKGVGGTLENGIYQGLGVGVVQNQVLFELLYSVNKGKFKQNCEVDVYDYYGSNYEFDAQGDIQYSKLSISIGYVF